MRSYRFIILVALLILVGTVRPASDARVSLEVSPLSQFQGGYFAAPATVYYTIRLVSTPAWVCTGWYYPVVELTMDEWPIRRSCRVISRPVTVEAWGWRPLLPYIGEYYGFVEFYASPQAKRPEITVTRLFRVLERLP